jgi:hypothetical protein
VQRGSVVFNSLCGGDPGQVEREGRCGYDAEDLIPKVLYCAAPQPARV